MKRGNEQYTGGILTGWEDHNLLRVSDLTLTVRKEGASISLLQHISFSLDKGKCLGIIGESGAGKSMLGRVLLGLLPKNIGSISGNIYYGNRTLSPQNGSDWKSLRGNKIAMVFQNAAQALNPLIRVGKQVTRVIRTHKNHSFADAREQVLTLFAEMKLENPERVYNSYPHQLSGGMNQRVMLSMALSCSPELIIADEPTSALDHGSREAVLQLLETLQKRHGFSLILITHNIQIAAQLTDSLMVMRGGRILEYRPVEDIFASPSCCYTQQILEGDIS